MSKLVGVHGIAQQQVGRHQLQAPWARALADGMERSAGHRVAVPTLDIAFYGDLFLPLSAGGEVKGSAGDADVEWADTTGAEISDVIAAAGEVLSDEEVAAAAQASPDKGFERVPLVVQATVAGLDRRFGAHAGALFLGELRQVRRYLLDADLKTKADARVAEAVTGGCRILIGHSLGSVVAFEFLRQHPECRLDLLLTLGSPLGLRTIRQLMPDPEFGAAEGVPTNVGLWVNLRDSRDPVACAGSLTGWWPGIRDGIVDNQKSAHSVERYLSKIQAGDAVLSVAPELAHE
jgi:hypothetical protein